MPLSIQDFQIIKNNANANASDPNSVRITVVNGNEFASGVSVVFSLNGSACFHDGQQILDISTDVLGAAEAEFVDGTAETITLTAYLKDFPEISNSVVVNFTEGSLEVDNIHLLLVKNDALADGSDENIVSITSLSGNVTAPQAKITLKLDNGAIFIDGSSNTEITTNDEGIAVLPFTNENSGPVKVSAYLKNNIAIFYSVTANFTPSSPNNDFTIQLLIDANDAAANGTDTNEVHALVQHKGNGEPVLNAGVTFRINSGSALFENGQDTFTIMTNQEGKAYARLTDHRQESVIILATTDNQVMDTTTVNFSQEASPLLISRVYNTNRTFSKGQPTVAFKNGKFNIDVTGGSGDYSWSISPSNTGVSVRKLSANTGQVSFSSQIDPAPHIVTITDLTTSDTIEFQFPLGVFIYDYGQWNWYPPNNSGVFQYLPTVNHLVSLVNEWGDMRNYPGWMNDGPGHYYYWTNKYWSWGAWANAVSLANGQIDDVPTNKYTCGYALTVIEYKQ